MFAILSIINPCGHMVTAVTVTVSRWTIWIPKKDEKSKRTSWSLWADSCCVKRPKHSGNRQKGTA